MKVSIIENFTPSASELTEVYFDDVLNDATFLANFKNVQKEHDEDLRDELIKELPSITWQAYFEGEPSEETAQPNGLFVLEVTGIQSWGLFYQMKVMRKASKLGIVYAAYNIETRGLTLVARCRPELHTLLECQEWLCTQLEVKSYANPEIGWTYANRMVPQAFILYMNNDAIFTRDPATGTVYVGGLNETQETYTTPTADITAAVLVTKKSDGTMAVQTYGIGGENEGHDYNAFLSDIRHQLNFE